MSDRGSDGDLRDTVEKLAELHSAPPWQQVLLRYKPGALRKFLNRSRTQQQTLEDYKQIYADLNGKLRAKAFVALIEGLAHCANELATPLRKVAYEQAALKAQGKRVPGTGHYSQAADIDVRRKKSYAERGIKKARSVLLFGYALTIREKPLSIHTWRPMRSLLVALLALDDDPNRTKQQKDEACYVAIRSLLRTLETANSVSPNRAKAILREIGSHHHSN